MKRVLDIDEAAGRLLVRFDYHPRIKAEVKAMGARFDWEAKVWHFPLERATEVRASLEALGFVPLPGLSAFAGEEEDTHPHWTVGALNAAATGALTDRFPQALWLVAEVSNLRKHRAGPHLYFELVERAPDGRIGASVNAVLFRGSRERVESRLREAGITLEDELAICVRGRPTIYAQRGSFQFVIDDVDPRFSLGEFERRREEILATLRAEALAARNLSLPVPPLPRRIALLTSSGSEAEADFLETLRTSNWSVEVTRFDVRVQGDGLAESVCAALASLRPEAFDLVVVTRGGGSRVELSSWDDLRVARALATLPIPALVAIGHENDRSVLDEIARSAKTPTAAAQWIVDALDAAEEEFQVQAGRALQLARERLQHAERKLDSAALHLQHRVEMRLHREEEALSRSLPARLRLAARDTRDRAASRLDDLQRRTRRAALRGPLRDEGIRLDRHARMLCSLARLPMSHEDQRLRTSTARLRLADPMRVIERGFVMMRSEEGDILGEAASLQVGARLLLDARDARLYVRVEGVEPTTSATPTPDRENEA